MEVGSHRENGAGNADSFLHLCDWVGRMIAIPISVPKLSLANDRAMVAGRMNVVMIVPIMTPSMLLAIVSFAANTEVDEEPR